MIISWIAVCVAPQCAHGSVVFVRRGGPDPASASKAQMLRNRWARLHRRHLHHRVLCYQRPARPRTDYPQE